MFKHINEQYEDRIYAVQEAVADIYMAEVNHEDPLSRFISKTARFVGDMFSLEHELCDEYFESRSFDQLLALNHTYYEDIAGEAYKQSFVNPDVSTREFGKENGQIISAIAYEVRSLVAYAFEHRRVNMMWVSELFEQSYKVLSDHRDNIKDNRQVFDDLRSVYKQFVEMDLKDKVRLNLDRKFNVNFNTYSAIAKGDLDGKHIFRYGMYIGRNEIELFKYFRSCSKEKLQSMADTYTQAYFRGFDRNNVSLSGKKTTNVGYHIGFEPVVALAMKNLEEKGLEALVYYDIKGVPRPRIINTKPSKQMEYDHKMDDALYMDKAFSEKSMKVYAQVFEELANSIDELAGIGLFEVFGEVPFAPESKDTTCKYDDDMSKIITKYKNGYQNIFGKYLPRSKYSFVIISYPVPEIGEAFAEIFDATIEVNTLDEQVYMDIQQKIIEALDQGQEVHITGRNGNRTDIYVALNPLGDLDKETNFNNCTADVNVPVGEVFTTPRLEGTHGKLHVKEVYLHGLKYVDLDIDFKDGMMDAYTCKNFDDEEKNSEFIRENLTHPHKTLPLGEFAIGTNTKAYVMAKKYNIENIIPILIGEKMGPHFAVGDTCYTWSEDTAVFNPDGREIVARENSVSKLRSSDLEKAYTYCHTDITIPYSELGEIVVVKHDGGVIHIIKDGRFVLSGTEALNDPLKTIEV